MFKIINKNNSINLVKQLFVQNRQWYGNEINIMDIFDNKTKYLQRERVARDENAEVYDYLKKEIGFRLADRVLDIKRKFKLAADIGCNRGHVYRNILDDTIEEIVLCDSNKSNLDQIENNQNVAKTVKRLIDFENIQLEENSYDLVISNLSLHWINNLPKAFKDILKALKNDGVFIASMFGCQTLYQLRCSLQLAESERLGGMFSHVSPFTQLEDISTLLTRAGFTMLTIDTDDIQVNYPTMFELMIDLKGMGENNAAKNRCLHLNRDVIFAAASIYNELYGQKNEQEKKSYVPATFQIINMIGWKPDPTQPKPIERGTGQFSLKDLDKLNVPQKS